MAYGAHHGGMTAPSSAQITLRPAYADDDTAVRRLAALDSSPLPPRPLLLAEADGVLRAALSTRDGSSIADPFYRSARLVALLRAHAAQPVLTRRTHRRRPAARLAHS